MPDFPLTVEDSFGDPVTFDVSPDGLLTIEVPGNPITLDDSADREAFAKVLTAAIWEADRLEATP